MRAPQRFAVALGFGLLGFVGCKVGEGSRCICADDCRNGLVCVVNGDTLPGGMCTSDPNGGQCVPQSADDQSEDSSGPPMPKFDLRGDLLGGSSSSSGSGTSTGDSESGASESTNGSTGDGTSSSTGGSSTGGSSTGGSSGTESGTAGESTSSPGSTSGTAGSSSESTG